MVDIDPILRPSLSPLRMFIVLHAVMAHEFYGWTDDTYMHILQHGQPRAQVDITFMPVPEDNEMKYTLQTV